MNPPEPIKVHRVSNKMILLLNKWMSSRRIEAIVKASIQKSEEAKKREIETPKDVDSSVWDEKPHESVYSDENCPPALLRSIIIIQNSVRYVYLSTRLYTISVFPLPFNLL